MRKLLILTMILFSVTTLAGKPKWIEDISKGCKKKELCAVGEGESTGFAQRNARTALAKIFSTKIKSKFTQEIASHVPKARVLLLNL